MQDHGQNGGSKMMWLMALCCMAPIVIIALVGVGGTAAGTPWWLTAGFVVLMVGAHLFMMKGHK